MPSEPLDDGNSLDNENGREFVWYDAIPSYDVFLSRHLEINEPCVIGPKATEGWIARSTWQTNDKPNFDHLDRLFGRDRIVQVAICDQRDFTDQKRIDMTFGAFTDAWRNGNTFLYLKDVHLVRILGTGQYECPPIFRDDWLNSYVTRRKDPEPDDFRFAYFGPKGTFTPLHHDVHGSFSWSANICGVKRWLFWRPDQANMVKHLYDPREEEGIPKPIVITQRAGEIVFVPSNWYHMVENVTDTISINHNWANASNLVKMTSELVGEFETCRDELIECGVRDVVNHRCERDGSNGDTEFFNEIVEDILYRNSGMGWRMYREYLNHAIEMTFGRNLDRTESSSDLPLFPWPSKDLRPSKEYIANQIKLAISVYESMDDAKHLPPLLNAKSHELLAI